MANEQFIYMSLDDFVKWKENTLVHNGEQIPYNPNVVPFVPDKTPEQIAALQTELETLRTNIATLEESSKKYYKHYICMNADSVSFDIHFDIYSSAATPFTSWDNIPNGYYIVGFDGTAGAGVVFCDKSATQFILSGTIADNSGLNYYIVNTVVYLRDKTFTDTVTEL